MGNNQFTYAEEMAMKAANLTAFSSINLRDIKNKVESLLGLIGRDGIFDEYTKHDISHINGMLMSLDYIIRNYSANIIAFLLSTLARLL